MSDADFPSAAALPWWSDAEIVAERPDRFPVDPWRPYAQLVEPEHSAAGRVEPVATIFLTNRECGFRCLMCDLWKHTTRDRVPLGAIPAQIRHALDRLPPADHVKLYNSGNFFDAQAIPPEDHPAIAKLVGAFQSVIVENHPRLCDRRCLEFRDRLAAEAGSPRGRGAELEIALGLETVHPDILPRLNKRMTLDDFRRAAERLRAGGIRLRTFILLRPPGLTEVEGREWAMRSLEFAFDQGVDCAAVIPTRGGNGIMERLAAAGQFEPPTVESLEWILEAGLRMRRGRVMVDLWDFNQLARCAACRDSRRERLQEMNLTQSILPPVACASCAR